MGEGVAGVRGRGVVGGVERCSSLYRVLGGWAGMTRLDGGLASVAQLNEGLQEARGGAAPAGEKGWLRVSMCQIASARWRAMSIWATLAPRWRPRRCLLR